LALLLPGGAFARGPVQTAEAPAWSAAQAVGAPDAGAGDNPHAWAPLAADGGLEWLEVRFERAVDVAAVVVVENEAPGAVTRVLAGDAVVWEGAEPRATAPARPAHADRVRIELDTTRVGGWNEIDAVQLVGTDGSRQWAYAATASSSYADAGAASTPFAGLIGQTVRAHLDGEVLEGRLVSADGNFVRLEAANGRVFVVALHALRYLDK
jgi:hypothetical protein